MKKKVIASLAVLGLVTLTGCSGKNVKTNTAEKASAAAKTTSNKIQLKLSEVSTIKNAKANSTFTSSNDKVVTVDKKGNLHGIKEGTAKVTVKTGDKSSTCHVTVNKHGMVYPSFSMMKTEKLTLQFSSKDTVKNWKSSNPSVAAIGKDGNIHAKKVGSAVIYGKNSKHKFQCNIKVTKYIKNVIYLTFDDGPNKYTTPKVLKVLKKYNVKATFFELRPARTDNHLTKQLLEEGHTLAMHGWQHKYDRIYKSEAVYRNNLDKLRRYFFKRYGYWCTLTRFPGGSSNTVSHYNPGIMTRLTKKLDGWGYHYFDWNVSSGDAGDTHTADGVFRSFKRELCKGHGNVVLMHDFTHNDKTINALPRIIAYGRAHGFVFRPLTASTQEVHHHVNN